MTKPAYEVEEIKEMALLAQAILSATGVEVPARTVARQAKDVYDELVALRNR